MRKNIQQQNIDHNIYLHININYIYYNMLTQQFRNLTIKQATDLQKLVYNILQQSNHISQYNTTETPDLQNKYQIENFLLTEINNRNTIITELAHMTIAILDEVMRHIQDNREIQEQLQRNRGELKGYTDILFSDKEYVDLLSAQNEQLKTEIEAVRNQKDLANFKNQLAIMGYEKEKDLLKKQIQSLRKQLDFQKTQIQLIQSTKVNLLKKQNSQLVQNNIKIQQQLQIAKKYLEQIESKSKIANNLVKYQGQNNTDQLNLICPETVDKFNELDTSIRDVDKKSYNLMAELEINLNTQNKTYIKKQYIVQNLTQRSFSQAQTPTQIRLEIDQQQNEILLQNQSIVTHQQKSIQVHQQKIPLSNKNSKEKNNLPSNSPAFIKKQQFKDKKMSRIKYLLANLGGDNNYSHKKCERFEAVKKIREQQSKIFPVNKLANSKIIATLTQATLSPISSVAGLKTLSS